MFGNKIEWANGIDQCDNKTIIHGLPNAYYCLLKKGHKGDHRVRIDTVILQFFKLLQECEVSVFTNKIPSTAKDDET